MFSPEHAESQTKFLATVINKQLYDEVAVDDCFLILCHPGQQLLFLNPIATTFWVLLKSGMSIEEISRETASRLGASSQEVSQQLHNLVTEWEKALTYNSFSTDFGQPGEQVNNQHTFEKQSICFYKLRDFSFSINYTSKDVFLRIHPLCSPWLVSDDNRIKKAAQHNFTLEKRDGLYVIWKNGNNLSTHSTLETLKGELFSCIAAGGKNIEWLAILHAGALSYKGRCIIFPAKSGSGKTCFTAYASFSGLNYLGDDIVPISCGDQKVWPLPTALSIKKNMWTTISHMYPCLMNQASQWVRGREVRFLPVACKNSAPTDIKALVFPHYQANQKTGLKEISSATAIQLLMESNSWFGHPLDKTRIQELVELIESLPKYTLTYGDVHKAVNQIQQLFNETTEEVTDESMASS